MSDITRDYSFGGWLKHLRHKKGLSLAAAANSIGMNNGNLSKLERSELAPPTRARAIEKILEGLDALDHLDLLKSIAFQHHLSKLKQEFDL